MWYGWVKEVWLTLKGAWYALKFAIKVTLDFSNFNLSYVLF